MGDGQGEESTPGPSSDPNGPPQPKTRRKRDAVSAEDWTRIRKDNHKEVERRRRGTINSGINDLSAIVPSGPNGEKAKGAILARAVNYIRQLKENEARNIEKWTLEKLLMDQAMGDLQAQIEDLRKRWDEERGRVVVLENELDNTRKELEGSKRALAVKEEKTDSDSVPAKRQRVE